MLYQFKQQPEDFLVEEFLPTLPSGKGDVFYVYFEKKNLTTMEVLDHLQRQLSLSRENLGIAGLKDKVGITRQWISVFHSALERAWGRDRFLFALGEVVKVLQTTWGEKPLRIGGNAGNRFAMRLRAVGSSIRTGQEIKKLIEENIERVKAKGFPNCFGSQRFGKGNKNFWEAKEVITSSSNPPSPPFIKGETYHLRFMLQAYASMYFNEYVMMRWEKGLQHLQGDILVDRYFAEGAKIGIGMPTWPMLWWDLLLPEKGSKARVREDWLMEFAGFDGEVAKKCQLYHLWWIRRPLWVYVDDLECCFVPRDGLARNDGFDREDILLKFSLPTGSYATVLLAFILEGVDRQTLKDNRLEIPRREK